MAKYTTMLRTICEYEAGLEQSVGFESVNDVLNKSYNKIFTTDVNFFDENYKPILLKKILKHYYLREIGCETVGIFKLWLNTKLEEIMPYYNKLYESANLQFNPIYDYDVTTERNVTTKEEKETDSLKEFNGTGNKQLNESGTSSESSERLLNSESGNIDKYSDTPQGTVNNLNNNTYLTNARIVDGEVTENVNTSVQSTITNGTTENTTNESTNTENEKTESNSLEDYIERRYGKTGGYSYSKMIEEYRNILLNIDLKVIDEFEELFLQIW